MNAENKLYGLVVCGGKSIRMGFDKSKLVYHKKPIRYHLYEILEKVCGKVFISCNSSQADEIDTNYNTLTDLKHFENTGPVAALLTAFAGFPNNDFLVIGCDYPFINESELKEFLSSLKESKPASAFYNSEENLFEPLLGFYSNACSGLIEDMYQNKKYSLQYFLKNIDADKYFPSDKNLIKSINTQGEFYEAKEILKNKEELFN